MNWLKKLATNAKVKAVAERVWRGGVAGVGTAIALGQLSVDDLLGGHDYDTLWHAFAGGAVTTFLLALGIAKVTGTGPAINKAEAITPK